MASLLRQLRERGERQPHLIVASFSLHYLKPDERRHFFELLARLVTRPLLLVIIKGVGETQRPQKTLPSVRSVFFGVHYYVGNTSGKPRVVEAHACLIAPAAAAEGAASPAPPQAPAPPAPPPPAPPAQGGQPAQHAEAPVASPAAAPAAAASEPEIIYDRDDPDSWVLCTFASLERRCNSFGLYTGVTEIGEEKML